MWLNLEWCIVLGGVVIEPWRKMGLVASGCFCMCLHLAIHVYCTLWIFALRAKKVQRLCQLCEVLTTLIPSIGDMWWLSTLATGLG